MIKHTFKKDSRVWLHKNSNMKANGHDTVKFSTCQQRHTMRNTLDEEDMEISPPITGADGRVYKKDSRTWLHKSSVRTIAKAAAIETLRKANEKNPRRMQNAVNKVKMMAAKERWKIGPVRAHDSYEKERSPQKIGGINAWKREKNAHRGRTGLASISHRDIHMVQGADKISIGKCNQCYDKRPRVRYGKGSFSDNDNTNDESSSDTDYGYDNEDEDTKFRVTRRLSEHTTGLAQHTVQDIQKLKGIDGLACRRSAAAVEITQEGINAVREIAWEMQLQPVQRSAHLMEHADLSLTPEEQPLNKIDNSLTGLSSSKSSLNVSDECLSEHGGVPRAQSDYQLSHATQGLNVQSPPSIQHRYVYKDLE